MVDRNAAHTVGGRWPSGPRRLAPRRAAWAALGALLLAGPGPVAPAGAQDQSLSEARAQREATLADKARVAAELSVLGAQEGELRRALEGLDEALAFQDAEVRSASRALAEARDQVDVRRREAHETAARVEVRRDQAGHTVVNAYIGASGGRQTDLVLGSGDANELVRRQQLLGLVEGNLRDDLDRLRALVEDQRRAEAAAAEAVADAARLADELAAAQAELQRQRDAEARLTEALRARIGDWQAKAAELDRAERELDAVIQRRQQEEAAAAAATAAAAAAAAAAASAVADDATGGGDRGGGRTVSLGLASASGYVFPADGPVTSSFGWRRHPVLGISRLHAGTDIGAGYGSDVWAAKAGVVIFAGWNGGYGNCVMIEHDGGVVTLYGHMASLSVSEGQSVGQGTVIGAVGSTGLSTGPHLHFETRVNGQPEDPMLFLS